MEKRKKTKNFAKFVIWTGLHCWMAGKFYGVKRKKFYDGIVKIKLETERAKKMDILEVLWSVGRSLLQSTGYISCNLFEMETISSKDIARTVTRI